MSFLLKKNNARTIINQVGGLNASALSVIVADVSSFPNGGDFLATTWDKVKYPNPADDPNTEILKVTNVVNKTFTIERGQENTVGKVHASGSIIECLITAGTFEEIENEINASIGNMTKIVYDTNDNGIVDKSESVDDGVGNSKTASEIKTHIDDTTNPHSVDKTDVGLTDVPNLDTTDAVNNEHTQNTDTVLRASIEIVSPKQTIGDSTLYAFFQTRYSAQTFRADKTGTLDSVTLTIKRQISDLTNYADLECLIVDTDSDEPTVTILGNDVVAKASINTTNTEVVFTFSGVNVTAGVYYAFVLRQVANGGDGTARYIPIGANDNGDYSLGDYYYTNNNGTNWYKVDDDWDIEFSVIITGTPFEDSDLINNGQLKANLDANSKTIQNLKAPYNNGDALRKTATIDEDSLDDAIDKKHSQNTDTGLDVGGANSVSAEEIRNHIDATSVDNEELTSQIDGLTNSFTTAFNYVPGTLKVYVGGSRQIPGSGKDYIEIGLNRFDLNYIPASTEKMIIDYTKNDN